ncbi:MAG: tetratricopeptide repeat protein [Spirochaetota bacterium]
MNTEEQNQQNPLDQIVYISLPEDAARTIEGFTLDPKILIPVEIPDDREAWTIDNLSWEMIVSAMLKIFAYNPRHKDIDYYRRFIHTVQPNLVAELTKTGIIKAEAKEYDLAEEIFLSLAHFAPEIETTFLNLAFCYEDQAEQYKNANDFTSAERFSDKAFHVYMNALEEHPDSPDLHFYAGYFFMKQNNLSKALEYFELFLGLAEDDERAQDVQEIVDRIRNQSEDDILFTAAFEKIKAGHEQEALDDISSFLSRHEDVWNAWFLKGWAHRRLEQYEQGKQALETCVKLEPSTSDVYNELAICCMELKFFTEAEAHLKKALTIEPDNVKIISNLGVLALKQEDAEQAAYYFRIAAEIDPEDPLVVSYLEQLG